MSSPSPLQNQDNLASASSPKSRVQITVLTILALHVVVIGGLLLQGCDKKGPQTAGSSNSGSNIVSSLPPLGENTNYFSAFPGDGGRAAQGSVQGGGVGSVPPASTDPGHSVATGQNSNQPPTGNTTLPPLVPANPAPQNNNSEIAAVANAAGANGNGAAAGGNNAPAGGAPVANPAEHIVKSGDFIADIAKKYGVTPQAVLDANPGVNPRKLKVDAKLNIPAPKPVVAKTPAKGAAATGTPADAAAADSADSYIVKQGDNLAKIAKKYGITVNQLRAANKIKGDRITPKQRLVIPTKSVPPAAPKTSPAGGGANGPA